MDLTTVSKALQNDIRQAIIEDMPEEGVTSSIVSEKYGITKSISLRHLESLERAGLLLSERDRSLKGKPATRFYLNSKAKQIFSLGRIKIQLSISGNGKKR